MPYTPRQRRIIAEAMARTGSLSATVRYLWEHSLECTTICQRTLERLRHDPDFAEMVAEKRTALRAQEPAAPPAPLIRESSSDRIGIMERMAWDSFQAISRELSRPEADLTTRLAFWSKVQGFTTTLKGKTTTVISARPDVDDLFEACRNAVTKEHGWAAGDKLIDAIDCELKRLRQLRKDEENRRHEEERWAKIAEMQRGEALASTREEAEEEDRARDAARAQPPPQPSTAGSPPPQTAAAGSPAATQGRRADEHA